MLLLLVIVIIIIIKFNKPSHVEPITYCSKRLAFLKTAAPRNDSIYTHRSGAIFSIYRVH